MGIECRYDFRHRVILREILRLKLCVAAFADSEHRNIPDSLYDPKIAFGHV